jgi:hypothetical protein
MQKPTASQMTSVLKLTTDIQAKWDDFLIGSQEPSAALLHHGKLVTKKQDDYVTTAATAPRLRK